MKFICKLRKISVFIILIVFIANGSLASEKYRSLISRKGDFEDTYMVLEKGPNFVLDGDLIVIGDSYGMLFCEYCDKELNYIVHQGYNIKKIYDEFLPLIDSSYKYAFLMIGPNDFCQQVNIDTFEETFKMLIRDLKQRGMKVIVTDYTEPDYRADRMKDLRWYKQKCKTYDNVIKETIEEENLLYVGISDIITRYGLFDAIHPSIECYPKIFERVERVIKEK